MNKKMRAILAKIQEKTLQAKAFLEGEEKDLEKASQIMKEVEELQKEYDCEKAIYDAEKMNVAAAQITDPALQADPVHLDPNKAAEDHIAMFVKAVKSFVTKGLAEGVDANGGYTVPDEISTQIQHYKEVSFDLGTEIDVKTVHTNKGADTYQIKGTADAFVDVEELAKIGKEIPSPTFKRLAYAIKDRAGFMPVSNDLIADSDADIVNLVSEWLAKADVATCNKNVLEKIKLKSEVDFKDYKGIKTAVTVTLGQAYKNGSKIYTNDDGLNYLDLLEDKNGRPLLNPDPTDSAKLTLRCGNVVLPVVVIPNKVLATADTHVPFIVGDLKEYMRRYDRQLMTIVPSKDASIGTFNAFAQNMTIFRAILRDDYVVKDEDAIVRGYITVAPGK